MKIYVFILLVLHFCSIGNDGIKAIAKAIKNKKHLKTLDVHYNSFNLDGGLALIDAIKTLPQIASIDISYNTINNRGGYLLANALKGKILITRLRNQIKRLWENKYR